MTNKIENFLQVKHGLIIKNEYWFHYMIQKNLVICRRSPVDSFKPVAQGTRASAL